MAFFNVATLGYIKFFNVATLGYVKFFNVARHLLGFFNTSTGQGATQRIYGRNLKLSIWNSDDGSGGIES
jgi:hypothetical protein